MRRAAGSVAVGVLALALAGCGGGREQADDGEATPSHDAEETVFDDTIQTQERARAVEGVTMEHKADLDAAIDADSGDASRESDE